MICYFILLKTDITTEIFKKSLNFDSGPLNLRRNDVNTKVVLKFNEKDIPFEMLNKSYTPFTTDEILTEMKEAEWAYSELS